MNKLTAELIQQAINVIQLEAYLKKAKIKQSDQEIVDTVLDYLQYEMMRCVKDLVLTERL